MPRNTRNNKKKSRNRSTAAVFCAQCRKKLTSQTNLSCVCTKVNFCNTHCRQLAIQSGSHICSGAPSHTNTLNHRTDVTSPLDNPSIRSAWQREYQETIQTHVNQTVWQEGIRGNIPPENPGPDYYAQLADEQGSAACAYMAGIQYKNRLLGSVMVGEQGEGIRAVQSRRAAANQLGVLETDELAFQYLLQASQAGIGIAMQSLADLYFDGQGVRESRIIGNNWLWHAVLLQSAGALVTLDSRALIPIEMNGMVENLARASMQAFPGQGLNMCGPHLTSLLASFCNKLSRMRFQLAPFAAVTPTLTVGNPAQPGTTGNVTLIAKEELGQLVQSTQQLAGRGHAVQYVYGRRGVAKAASAQTYGDAKARIADFFLYVVPPDPQCDDQYDKGQMDAFCAILQEREFLAPCLHSENTSQAYYYCPQCLDTAEKRLSAVSRGCIAISLHETLPGRGLTALWKDEQGNVQSETFKQYSRGEVEGVLAALVACEPELAHSLFVAQDPNFLWPLIAYHGTVRAALEYVAPHVDWNDKLGTIEPSLERQGIVQGINPGNTLARCCNNFCTKLERYKKLEILQYCGGCQAQFYCSEKCAKVDWIIHKNECSGGSRSQNSSATESRSTDAMVEEKPKNGEEVVIHGLLAKPEYNGKIGVVMRDIIRDGRYPIKLFNNSSTHVLAVKPANIYQLGVSISQSSGKSRKLKCSAHKQELCDGCCLDFQIVNHLSKLHHLNQSLTKQKVEEIAELNFANIEVTDTEQKVDPVFPIECAGLEVQSKRFVLKSLLSYSKEKEALDESVSKEILFAINGLCSYSAGKMAAARPFAVMQLLKLPY